MLRNTALAAVSALLLLSSSVAAAGDHPAGTASGNTLVVATDGSADHMTITAAIEAAVDGDTILVQPGTYVESLVIEKDISLTGDGPREDIVLSVDAGPILRLLDSDAVVRGLTFRGPTSEGVQVVNGSPLLEDLAFDSVGAPWAPGFQCSTACDSLTIGSGSTATVRDSSFTEGGGIWAAASSPVIEDNDLAGGPVIVLWVAHDAAIVRGNTVIGAPGNAISVYMGDGHPLIEGNTVKDAGASGISVGLGTISNVDPIIRGNSVTGAINGITVTSLTEPTIEDNVLFHNGHAIVVSNANPTIVDNVIRDNGAGVFIMWGLPLLRGNEISGGRIGLGLGTPGARPTLEGNTITANATPVELMFNAKMPETAGNVIGPPAIDPVER